MRETRSQADQVHVCRGLGAVSVQCTTAEQLVRPEWTQNSTAGGGGVVRVNLLT